MYQLTDVSKLYAKGRETISAVRDLTLSIEDGQWLAVQDRTRQVDLAQSARRARSAHVGGDSARRERPCAAPRGPGDPVAGQVDRVHLPDVQPAAHYVGGRERRGRLDPAQGRIGRAPPARASRAGLRRP